MQRVATNMADLEDSSPLPDPSRGCSKKVRTILHGVIVTILFFVVVFTYVYLYRLLHVGGNDYDDGDKNGEKSYAIASLIIGLVAYAAVGCLYICNSSGRQEKIISAGYLVLVLFVFFLSSIGIGGHSLGVDYVSGVNIAALSAYCVWKLSSILQYCSTLKKIAVVAILLCAIVVVYSLYLADAPNSEDVAVWLLCELVAYNVVGCLYICNSSGRKEKIISAGFLLLVLFAFLLFSFVDNKHRVHFIFGANIVAISSYCIWKFCPDAVLAWLPRWIPVPAARGSHDGEPAQQEKEEEEEAEEAAGHELAQNNIRIQGLLREFTSDEIRTMTQDFGSMVGRGGFADVFRGKTDDGTEVAVKRIKITSEHTVASEEADFRREVSIVATAHHRSLVPLLGYCLTHERYLVYPFFKNGSLDRWLFHADEEKRRLLTWPKRYCIAVDVAGALAYLHNQCRRRILHLDVKPANILLDSHLRAVVSDFGISLSIGITLDMASVVNATGRGTIGYMAPEMLSEEVSDKCDVFSYGMTLLELVRGRRNNNPDPSTDASSPATPRNFFFPKIVEEKMVQGKLTEVVDAAMEPVDKEAVEAVVKVALRCIQQQRDMRPTMQTVVDMLVAANNLPPSPESRPSSAANFSEPSSSLSSQARSVPTMTGWGGLSTSDVCSS